MKTALLLLLLPVILTGCSTTETFSKDGSVTSRTRSPSPETWTTINSAVGIFGKAAVEGWVDQMTEQQKWERGQK